MWGRRGATRALVALTMGSGLLAVIHGPAAASLPAALSTSRVSVASDGSQANGGSSEPSISSDGRYVAFASAASNLVTGDSNVTSDVFVRDRVAGTTERVSLSSDETQGNASSHAPQISDDGRFVVFYSYATNFASGASGLSHVYVRDLVQGITERVSVASDGTPGDRASWGELDISGHGRFVTFGSAATNLDGIDTNNKVDIFLRDRQTATTVRVSEATDGTQANDESYDPTVSDTGLVAWNSSATNLVPGDTNQRTDVFLHDPHTSTTSQLSASGSGATLGPDLSADGSHLVYMSVSFSGSHYEAQVRDLRSGSVERIGVNSAEESANQSSFYPTISGDGRQVIFWSKATNLVVGDVDGDWDIFVRDRTTGTTEQVDVSAHGADVFNECCSQAFAISADGNHFAFDAWWTGATYVDDDTNDVGDIYVVSPAGADATGPTVTPVVSPAPGGSGWHNGSPTLRWRLIDPESNVTSRPGCDAVTIDADTGAGGTTYTCTASSSGGATVQSVTIRRDGTAPTVTGSVSPPDGANGWYVTAPQVDFTCSDATSGVSDCPTPVSVGEAAEAQSVTRSATDMAGNQASASVTGLEVDLSDPEVTCDTRPVFTRGEAGQVTATVADPVSGPAQPTVATDADTSRVGPWTVSVTGSDVAGRSATVTCGYDVHYDFTGFLGAVENPPTLNRVPARTTVPVKFRLDGFQGRRVVSAVGSAPVACSSTELVASTAQHLTTTTYLAETGTYKYPWSTRAAWRGTCRVFTLTLKDGTEHQARFRFTR